jgi:hypothetical protein
MKSSYAQTPKTMLDKLRAFEPGLSNDVFENCRLSRAMFEKTVKVCVLRRFRVGTRIQRSSGTGMVEWRIVAVLDNGFRMTNGIGGAENRSFYQVMADYLIEQEHQLQKGA